MDLQNPHTSPRPVLPPRADDQEPFHSPVINHGEPPQKDKATKSLAISLVVSAVLVLAAVGIAAWLFMTAVPPSQDESKGTSEDTSDVTKVSLAPPQDLSAAYAVSDQSTTTATAMSYYDNPSGCGITTSISLLGKQTPKQAAEELLKQSLAPGVAVPNVTDSNDYKLKDAGNAEQTYTFASATFEQDVDVQGVDFKKQYGAALYRQFGAHVAILSYSCRDSTWADKKSELQTLTNAFTVKTERG